MKRNILVPAAIFTSVLFACTVSARDIDLKKFSGEKKGVAVAAQREKDTAKKAKKAPPSGEASTTTRNNKDSGKSLASDSKQRHDTAQKIIDNLK